MTRLFLTYYFLLILGPIVFLGNVPLASYYFLLVVMLFLGLLIKIKNDSFFVFVPFYFKCYLLLMSVYLLTYLFNFFESDYVASIRDLIIIYTPLQYIILVNLLCFIIYRIESEEQRVCFIKSIIKMHLFLLFIVGIVAILQMFDAFNMQNILSKYYGSLNVGVWQEYIKYNPRASATFNLEPNTLGLYAGFSLVLFHIFKSELKLGSKKAIAIFFLGFVSLIFSGSFTGIIIYMFLTVTYLFLYKKLGMKTIIVALVGLLVFTSIFTAEIERSLERQKIGDGNIVPSSLKARMNNAWLTTYLKFEEEFINGIGPSAIQLSHSADNDFLDKFLRFGIVGGVSNILFVIILVVYPLIVRKSNSDKFIRKLFLFSSLVALAFALASITGSAFKAKRIAESLWILYSLPFIYIYTQRKHEASIIKR